MANSHKLLIPIILICLTAGCGDITGEISSIDISPSSVTVGVNQQQFFSALGKDSLGKIVQTSVDWSVQGGIGTINSSGFFTAGATEGSGYVVATSGTLSSKCPVTVTAKGWVSGVIKTPDGGLALGIAVYLHEIPTLLDETDVNGKYSISDIPAGTYTVFTQPTAIYLSGSSEPIAVGSGETKTWTTTLVYQPGYTTTTSVTIPVF